MNRVRVVFAAVVALAFVAVAPAARANVLIHIDKSSQSMTVSIDGVPRYHWTVSTGGSGDFQAN